METRDRDRNVSQRRALFCRERYVKDIKLFRERDGPRILSLKSVDYFGTSEYFSENFDVEAINWSGVGNFLCMQVSLVMSMRFIFGDD